METGVGEATYPVYGSVKWNKTYQAAVASPLSPADIFHGHVLFVSAILIWAAWTAASRSAMASSCLRSSVVCSPAFHA